jgi:protein-S-isoprenylcysteine O-methyltransferase Ste14
VPRRGIYSMRDPIRYILGYTVGITIFILLIPFGLYELSRMDSLVFKTGFIDTRFIRMVISGPIFLMGVIFMIWSNLALFKIGKGGPTDGFNIPISPRTKKLVTVGPYRYTRNPMVFGAFSLYFAIGIFLNSRICLISLIIFLLLMIINLKLTEEKRLLRDFGDEYTDYKNRVSMIFPIKK